MRWPGFPYGFQALGLGVFLTLIVAGWNQHAPPGVQPKAYAKGHLSTLIVWGLWWPSMVWAAVLLGRVWCAVCPLELVANVGERWGRRLGISQRAVPRWAASGGLSVTLYALVQLLVAGAQIHRVPAYTALFLLGLLLPAFGVALLFKDRAFCRGVCPVGQLLATYGRGGMLAVRAGSASACGACTGKDCLLSCNRTRLDARSCPSLLNPPRLNSNRDCLVCGQCIKACSPDNMQLLLRAPFSAQDVREPRASWPATVFVMLASGFVTWELLAEWPRGEEQFLAMPRALAGWLGVPGSAGLFAGLWALFVVPSMAWTAAFLSARALGSREGLGAIWRRLALPVAMVVAGGHMAKALAKFASWVVFLPWAVRDPIAGGSVRAAASGGLSSPPPLLPLPPIAWVGATLVVVAACLAVRDMRLAAADRALDRRLVALPLALGGTFLGILLLGWARV